MLFPNWNAGCYRRLHESCFRFFWRALPRPDVGTYDASVFERGSIFRRPFFNKRQGRSKGSLDHNPLFRVSQGEDYPLAPTFLHHNNLSASNWLTRPLARYGLRTDGGRLSVSPRGTKVLVRQIFRFIVRHVVSI